MTLRDLQERVDSVILDPNPCEHPDERRRWQAARDVSNGPISTLHMFAWLERSRQSHMLHEGIDR